MSNDLDRDNFEAWARTRGRSLVRAKDGEYCFHCTRDMWRAWQSAATSFTPPEGFVLVPVEPDCSELPNYAAGLWSRRSWDAALDDLLAARPEVSP